MTIIVQNRLLLYGHQILVTLLACEEMQEFKDLLYKLKTHLYIILNELDFSERDILTDEILKGINENLNN